MHSTGNDNAASASMDESPSPMPQTLSEQASTSVATQPGTVPAPVPAQEQQRPLSGILRLDINRPRRSSGGSVDFRCGSESNNSGVTSPHQLSVTWAPPCDFDARHELRGKPRQSNADVRREYYGNKGKRSASHGDKPYEDTNYFQPLNQSYDYTTDEYAAEVVRRLPAADNENDNDNEDDEEDYSQSVSAIIQRRASVRGYRSKRGSRYSRRASSPMDHVLDTVERRRSSVYTTSSDEGTNQESTQEQIFENIRLHKEVIQSVKHQPWHIRKKLKLVRQAKTYVARHEGALQERFAMSRSTRDLWARFKILMAARWRHWKRETTSFLTVLIPWELRIKEIESHFGSGVASYFTFLRWLMWVNIMIAIPLVAFVIGPEYFATKHDETDPRKKMSDEEFKSAGNLSTFWEFEGYIKYSPMFYGYYSSTSGISTSGYKLPLAYFLTAVLVYIYSFVATLRKMAENSRNSKLSSKDDECVFSWKLFTGWDFMIGHAETAHNRIASVVVGFKEALLEEAEKKKDNRNWRIILQRILVNILILALLITSGYTVVWLVSKSEEWAHHENWLSRNAVNVTMTLLSFFLPMIFEALGLFENWHPRQQLRLQLARIMILNMLNLYSLMFSFIYKINSKEDPLQDLKGKNESFTKELDDLLSSIDVLRSLTTTTTTATTAAMTTTTLSYDDTSTTDISSTLYSSSASDYFGSSTTTTEALFTSAATALYSTMNRLKCQNITLKCSKPTRITLTPRNITATLLLLNLTTSAMTPITTTPMTPDTPAPSMPYWPTTTTAAATSTTTTTTTTATATTTTPKPNTTTTTMTTTAATVNATFEEYDYASSDDASSTPNYTPSSTTTTAAPGNDSIFGFMDYFDGLSLEKTAADEQTTTTTTTSIDDDDNADDDYVDPGTDAQTRNAKEVATNAADAQQRAHVKERERRAVGDDGLAVERISILGQQRQTIRPSIYSKRQHNLTTQATTTTIPATYSDIPIVSTTSATTTTTKRTIYKIRNPPTTTTEMPTVQTEQQTTSEEPTSTTAEYTTTFSTSTSDQTDDTSTAASDSSTISSSTSSSDDDVYESTPYFIGYDNIADVGRTIYYDADELDTKNYDYCIVTICEQNPGDLANGFGATTSMDGTELDTTPRTPLELKMEHLKVVRQTLKDIQNKLTSMCWETSLGQELSKVIVFDGIMSIVAPLCIDFLRALFVRYVNQNWCWDMEKTFPQYGDFKIAENILTLINNQGQVWMGIFFSPGLVLINLVKLMIMMYFRSWIVLTCNVPHEVVFKASKSNNFYLSLLLTMLFLCVLPVGYAIVWLRPSWHCGPFSKYNRIAEFITNTTRDALPTQLHKPLNYLTSSSTVIPLLLLLILIIYYLISLTGALREANQDLRTQLQKEREEERKKIFKVPEVKQAEPTTTTLTNRWRKVLEASSPVTPTQPPEFESEEYKNQARRELISRIMQKALRKSSATSDEDSLARQNRDDDDTDTEHQDSLPHDEEAKDKRFGLSRLQQIRKIRKPSLIDIVQIAKSERARAASMAPSGPSTNNAAAKEAHPRSRFKIEKLEKKEREPKEPKESKESEENKTSSKSPPPYEAANDNDPDANSRIVRERRASLLSHQREGERRKPKETTGLISRAKSFRDSRRKKFSSPPKSIFAVVDEKKPQSDLNESTSTDPIKSPSPLSEIGIGKFKFRKNKFKITLSPSDKNEPDVFKFDENTVEQSKSKLGKSVDIPSVPSIDLQNSNSDIATTSTVALSVPPSPLPAFLNSAAGLRQANAEKLAQLSRQGRKKIGSLLSLMREAVNLKREEEQAAEAVAAELAGPSTSTQLPAIASSPTLLMSSTPSTAIDIPTTPEATESATPPPLTIASSESAPIPIKMPSAPPTPKLATFEDLEELDQPGPINFPMRSTSQRLRTLERPLALRQDSQSSNWSDCIPTITISTTGSDECIIEPKPIQNATADNETSTSPSPVVNIIKINIEDENK